MIKLEYKITIKGKKYGLSTTMGNLAEDKAEKMNRFFGTVIERSAYQIARDIYGLSGNKHLMSGDAEKEARKFMRQIRIGKSK